MRRVGWSLPSGVWRTVLAPALVLVGLFVVPLATDSLMDRLAPRPRPSPPPATSDLSAPWVPTARTPRNAHTTVTVEAIRTGQRITVEHVIELTAGDLLYDAVRGDMIPEDVVVEAVIGQVQIGSADSPGVRGGPNYGRFRLDRGAGSPPRLTVTATGDYTEGSDRTAVTEIGLTPPVDRHAAATTSTVTVLGVGYALDAVLVGQPAEERETVVTFTAPPGAIGVRLVRTARKAVVAPGYGGRTPRLPNLLPDLYEYELTFLAVLVPWVAYLAIRRPGRRSAPVVWALVAAGALVGAGTSTTNAIPAVAAPLVLAGWVRDNRALTGRAVRRYLLAAAALVGLGVALLLPVLPAAPWAILLGGCAVAALVGAPALAWLSGDRGWALLGAVAGAGAVLAYATAERGIGPIPFVMAVGLLWAPLLVLPWPARIPRWVGAAAVLALGALLFVAPGPHGDWRLPSEGLSTRIPWSVLARLLLVGFALRLLWKHTGPPPLPHPRRTVDAVRRRYRAFTGAAAAQRDPLVRAAGVALVAAASAAPYISVPNAVLAYVLVPLAVLATLRPRRDDSAERLARVTPRAFTRLLDTRAQARLAHRILDRLYRASPAHLASGELSLDAFRRLHTEAVTSARRGEAGARRLPVLASGAGHWAARNGAAAALVAAGLAAPLMIVEGVELFADSAGSDVLFFIETLRRLGRWAAYGFFFGCFYPSLRGGTPVAKALVLAAALAVPEGLLALFTSTAETPGAVLAAAALRAGQVVAVLLLLGVAWEYRLARTGRVPWSYLRDFRQVGAVAAPLSAIAVAVASAVVAVLVPELLGTAQPPPPGAP